MKITDETAYSVAATWSAAYAALKGTGWMAEDFDALGLQPGVAAALKWAYEYTGHDEDGVLAVLRATARHASSVFLTPGDVTAMAEGFQVGYPDMDYVLAQHLDENYDGLPLAWLSDRGRKGMIDEIKSNSEVWIDDHDLPGVWVFTKPGHQS